MIFKTIFDPLLGFLPGAVLKVLASLPGLSSALAFNGGNSRMYAYAPVSNRTSFPYTIF
jgi:hypothetical protein